MLSREVLIFNKGVNHIFVVACAFALHSHLILREFFNLPKNACFQPFTV